MSFTQDIARPRRKPSLTPMIDVVFLLLVFFMLASRFGIDAIVPLPLVSGGGTYQGPPRLIEVLPDGIHLNGLAIPETTLVDKVQRLTNAPTDVIILRGAAETKLQRVVTVGAALRQAGFTHIVLIE
jgi:biopolymer transport protein ExbD